MIRSSIFKLLQLAPFLFATTSFAQSQIGGASLNGTVTDPSGASVPNAKVTATNTATGLTRTTQTSDSGLYNFTGLPVGAYDLTVDARDSRRSSGQVFRCRSAPWPPSISAWKWAARRKR